MAPLCNIFQVTSVTRKQTLLMIIGKIFFFYPHLHINCVAPPCFRASQDKAFAHKNYRKCGQKKTHEAFAYRIYRHFTQQCRYKKVLTWWRGLSKIANKNADILYAMPLKKVCYFLDCKLMYISTRGADFLAKFALCAGRKCCTSGCRQERRGLKHVFLSSTFSFFSGDCVHS